MSSEREPLLDGRGQTAAAYTDPDAATTVKGAQHYNLVGLSAGSFWVLCVSMWCCGFLSAFDGTVVATLLGPISSSFMASNMASWLGTAYLLSVCCFTPIYGRLCNIIGRQPSMLIALGFFSVGNIMCAVAPSMTFLIAARAIAGIGGGGLTSVGSTIMSDLVPITHRGIFQGYGNILFGLGGGLGAPLGGIISDRLGWRWAFYFQIPLLFAASTLIFFKVRYTLPATPSASGASTPVKPQTAMDKLKRIDFLGSFLLAGLVGSALVAVSLKTNSTALDAYEWSDPVIVGLFATSVVLFLVFLYVELKVAAEPVLPIELLHRRTPVSVAINNLIISIQMFCLLYTVPLYYTAVRLKTATEAGRYLIPNSVIGSMASLASGFIVRHTGRYYWLTAFCGCCGIFSAVMLSTWGVHTPEWELWTCFVPTGLAMGSVTTLTIVALIADIGRDHIATATSLSYVFRTTGQVLGVALSGSLTQAVLQRELSARITGKHAAKIIAGIRQSSASIRTLPDDLKIAAVQSYELALHAVFMVIAVLSVCGVLSALFMREVDMSAPAAPAPKPIDEEEA